MRPITSGLAAAVTAITSRSKTVIGSRSVRDAVIAIRAYRNAPAVCARSLISGLIPIRVAGYSPNISTTRSSYPDGPRCKIPISMSGCNRHAEKIPCADKRLSMSGNTERPMLANSAHTTT